MTINRHDHANVSLLHQDDTIVITGTAGDGVRYERLKCVVATVSKGAIKVWPCDSDGKLWFETRNIESFDVLPNPVEETYL